MHLQCSSGGASLSRSLLSTEMPPFTPDPNVDVLMFSGMFEDGALEKWLGLGEEAPQKDWLEKDTCDCSYLLTLPCEDVRRWPSEN